MRHGFMLLEAVIYVAIATLLVYIVFSGVSRFIIPLQKIRTMMQTESIIVAVLAQMSEDQKQLAADHIVSFTDHQCVWQDADRKYRAWVFEKDALYYCTGVYDERAQKWIRVRRQILIQQIQGSFDTAVYMRTNKREYACSITSQMRTYQQRVVLRNGLIA